MLIGPDAGVDWEQPWNVYNEADFRQVAVDGNVVAGTPPVFPFVYLMDSFIQPVEGVRIDLQEPQVIVEIDQYQAFPFELGNVKGRIIKVMIHVFGKNRAERDDLAGYFMDYIGTTIDVKDYSAANPTGTFVEDAIIDPSSRVVEDIYTARADVLFSNVLMDWSRFSFSFRTQK